MLSTALENRDSGSSLSLLLLVQPLGHSGCSGAAPLTRFPPYFQTGLIVACYHGFVDTVVVLAECPHIDVNWQDSEGNTALITAAQAGKTRLFLP